MREDFYSQHISGDETVPFHQGLEFHLPPKAWQDTRNFRYIYFFFFCALAVKLYKVFFAVLAAKEQ